jgi:acyl dehydratase
MTLLARQLYFEAVKVGDELPPLVKPPVDRLQIARYAGAAGDWNPLYVDEPHAKNSGFPSALAPGMLAMGFLGELVVDWTRGARLRRFSARFVKIVWPGDVLTARGRVSDRRFEEGGSYAVDLECWAENQRGELVVRGLATFQLYYSAEDEAKQRAGGAPLVVTPAEEEARLAKLSRAQAPARPAQPPGGRPLAPPRPVGPPPAARPPLVPAATAPSGARPGVIAPSPRPAAPPAPRPAPAAAPARSALAATPARPAAAKPAAPARPTAKPAKPAKSAKPAKPGRPARPSTGKPGKAKAKAARPRPKKAARPEKAAARRAGAKKPSGKKRR